jgi:predicted O-methyltransferase YrrM
MQPIHLRNIPPPSETFDHISFLEMMAKWIKPENYLELGVRDSKCFKVISKYAIKSTGVDMQPLHTEFKKNMSFYLGSTDQYFESIKDTNIQFDFVFIDADHSHEQSLKDFMNVSKHIVEDGFIFLHDTYPYDPVMLSPDLCNDAYQTPLFIKQNLIRDFEVITLPFNPGLTIIKKMHCEKQLSYL